MNVYKKQALLVQSRDASTKLARVSASVKDIGSALNLVVGFLNVMDKKLQAIDSKLNRTYLYDSLADLEEQRRGGPPANLGAAAAAARAVLVAAKLKKGVGKAARDAEARSFSRAPPPPPRGQRQQHSDVTNPEHERDDPRRASLAPQPPSPTRKCGGKVYTAALEVDQV